MLFEHQLLNLLLLLSFEGYSSLLVSSPPLDLADQLLYSVGESLLILLLSALLVLILPETLLNQFSLVLQVEIRFEQPPLLLESDIHHAFVKVFNLDQFRLGKEVLILNQSEVPVELSVFLFELNLFESGSDLLLLV